MDAIGDEHERERTGRQTEQRVTVRQHRMHYRLYFITFLLNDGGVATFSAYKFKIVCNVFRWCGPFWRLR